MNPFKQFSFNHSDTLSTSLPLQRGNTPTLEKRCPGYETKLVVRLLFWSSGGCGVLLHCHYSQVPLIFPQQSPLFGIFFFAWSGRQGLGDLFVSQNHKIPENFVRLIIKPLGTFPSSPIIIGITITFMLPYFFVFFDFQCVVGWDGKVHYLAYSRFLLFSFIFFGGEGDNFHLVWLSACIAKSQKILCVSPSRTDSGLYIYHLVVCSNLNFLHNSQWIPLPTQSYLVLYSFVLVCFISL